MEIVIIIVLGVICIVSYMFFKSEIAVREEHIRQLETTIMLGSVKEKWYDENYDYAFKKYLMKEGENIEDVDKFISEILEREGKRKNL